MCALGAELRTIVEHQILMIYRSPFNQLQGGVRFQAYMYLPRPANRRSACSPKCCPNFFPNIVLFGGDNNGAPLLCVSAAAATAGAMRRYLSATPYVRDSRAAFCSTWSQQSIAVTCRNGNGGRGGGVRRERKRWRGDGGRRGTVTCGW